MLSPDQSLYLSHPGDAMLVETGKTQWSDKQLTEHQIGPTMYYVTFASLRLTVTLYIRLVGAEERQPGPRKRV